MFNMTIKNKILQQGTKIKCMKHTIINEKYE